MSSWQLYHKYVDEMVIDFICDEDDSPGGGFTAMKIFEDFSKYADYQYGTPYEEINMSLLRLSDRNFLTHFDDELSVDSYMVNWPLIRQHYHEEKSEKGSIIWKLNNIEGYRGLITYDLHKTYQNLSSLETENDSKITSKQQEIPIQNENDPNDSWSPLPIDRNTPAYKETIVKLENVIEVVRGSNGYTEVDIEEKETILWSLKNGLEGIKENFPSRGQLEQLIKKPLEFLSKKFAEATIGEAAKMALHTFLSWIQTFYQ